MRLHGRLLVGLHGREVDPQVMRYAAMVSQANPRLLSGKALLGSRPRRRAAARELEHHRAPLATSVANSNGDAEVRFVSFLPPTGRSSRRRAARAEREALRSHVAHFQAGMDGPVAVSYDVLDGRRIDRLSALAVDFDSDLVFVSESGGPRRQQIRVVREAPCPVWLAPAGSAPVLRRILVPIDFSSRSAACLQAAVDLARRFPPAKCLALHVDRHDTRCGGDDVDPERRRELLRKLRTFAGRIAADGVRVAPLIEKCHHVERAIARAADRHAVDLVVMSTRGRSRLAARFLSSVTEVALREWPGAMLVLKSPGATVRLRDALRERWKRAEDPQFS